jgi:hypothetical protein
MKKNFQTPNKFVQVKKLEEGRGVKVRKNGPSHETEIEMQ